MTGEDDLLSLYAAIVRKNDGEVRRLLDAGVSPNPGGGDEETIPLSVAVMEGVLSIVTTLLDARANPDVRSRITGFTPLHVAAVSGRENIVQELLGRGADPMIMDYHGKRPSALATSPELQELLRAAEHDRELLNLTKGTKW